MAAQDFAVFFQFLPNLKRLANQISPGCGHLILDMWSDRQKLAVLGIKMQFITTDWELKNVTVAFRHFTTEHTSDEIRKAFDAVLKGTLGITEDQVDMTDERSMLI